MSQPKLPKPLREAAGVAVGPGGITAAVVTRSGVHSVDVSVPDGVENATPAVLADALATLRERLIGIVGAAGARRPVSIALLPPLVETRLIELPPLRPGEASAILARDPRRYFLAGSTDDRVIRAADRPASLGGLVLAASASAPLVDAIRSAALAAGWKVQRVAPATGAWVAAARTAGARTVATAIDGTLHVLQLDDAAQPRTLRRFPQSQANEAAALLAQGPTLVVTENAALRAEIARGPTSVEPFTHDPEALTALHAATAEPELVTPAGMRDRAAHTRRSAARLAVAAVLMLVAAGALELWGIQRERDQIAARREEIRTSVPGLLELRDSLLAVEERRATLRELAGAGPTLTAALLNVATLLPGDAYITRFHSVGDSVTIQAVGSRAVDGVEALRRAPALSNVRLQGTVTRELREGSTDVERYTVVARVVEPETPIMAAADPADGTRSTEDGMTPEQGRDRRPR